MKRQGWVLILVIMLIAPVLSGCQDVQIKDLLKKNSGEPPSLIAVRIHFDRGEMLDGYVSELGMEQSGKIYAGGASISNIYDADGNVVGCFNYQKVAYMQILPAADENTANQ